MTSNHETLIHYLTTGEEAMDLEVAEAIAAKLTDAEAAESIANYEAHQAKRAELRERVMADPALRQVICPSNEWGTPEARYQIAQQALRIIERTAEKNDVTVDQIVAAFVANEDSMWNEMSRYRDEQGQPTVTDPRFDGYGSGNFYAFRFRVGDAVAVVTADKRKAERQQAEARREADWARRGLTRCDRCGGAGGHDGWPGFTCFDCGGAGAV